MSTIGSQFLTRVLGEAKEEAKEVKGYKFDRSVEAMKRALRDVGGENNFADKIAEVAAMAGIPGMYLNKPDVRESVLEAAQTLRSKPARVRSFLSLHSALTSFHGVTPVLEAKGEEDLEGNAFQQLVEEVLVSLGLPEEMVGSAAKPAVKSGLKRTVSKLRADDEVRTAFVAYARYAGIKLRDGVVGAKKPGKQPIEEAVAQADQDLMDDPVDAAKKIMQLLGVDFEDDKIVRVVNEMGLARAIKQATRAPKTKLAMNAFFRAAR